MLPFIPQTASTTLMPSVRANTCLEGSINLSDLIPRLSQEHKGEDAEATHCPPGEFERTSPFRFHVPSASHTLPALLGTRHARGIGKHWASPPHTTCHGSPHLPRTTSSRSALRARRGRCSFSVDPARGQRCHDQAVQHG